MRQSGRHYRMLCSLSRVGGGHYLLVRLRATFVSTHRTFLQAATRLAYADWAKQACLILGLMVSVPAHGAPKTNLHFAANHNFDAKGNYVPGRFGFNLADVSSATQLQSLSNGAKALVWVGQCRGVDATFLKTVRPFIGRSKVFGFYLMDDPDPTGRYNPLCMPDNLRVESDWIHSNFPGAKTYILLMNLASSKAPSFIKTYNADNSHIDLFGIDPYPCQTELKECDYEMINRYVAAAEAWGIRRSEMIPVYQVFGGGNWRTDTGGKYLLPTIGELQQILSRWGTYLPTPVFDHVYSWGSQNADEALEGSPDLQAVFTERNNASRP